jgi:hypothetical protein
VNLTLKMADYLRKGVGSWAPIRTSRPPAEAERSIRSAMPEEKFDDVEKVLSGQKQ